MGEKVAWYWVSWILLQNVAKCHGVELWNMNSCWVKSHLESQAAIWAIHYLGAGRAISIRARKGKWRWLGFLCFTPARSKRVQGANALPIDLLCFRSKNCPPSVDNWTCWSIHRTLGKMHLLCSWGTWPENANLKSTSQIQFRSSLSAPQFLAVSLDC